MSLIRVVAEGNSQHEELNVNCAIVKLKNSYLLLVSDEKEFGIGTVTLATKSPGLLNTNASTPLNFFGLKNNNLANLVSKTATNKLNSSVIVFLLVTNSYNYKDRIIMETVFKAVNNTIDDFNDDNNKI